MSESQYVRSIDDRTMRHHKVHKVLAVTTYRVNFDTGTITSTVTLDCGHAFSVTHQKREKFLTQYRCPACPI